MSLEDIAKRAARKLAKEMCDGWGQDYGERCEARIYQVVLSALRQATEAERG
jgi:hypothetical protein